MKNLSFQEIIATLQQYWRAQGCLDWLPYHETVGAGTYNSATVLRVLGPEPWNVAYVEPSFRPDDGRFADNPNRMQMHHQFQVIMQPPPSNPQELYLGSLKALGLNLHDHDIRFVEDNWESPMLGAWGLGWEVWLDGMEVTQFTYFQQAGGMQLDPPAVEFTYGLERLATYLQNIQSVWEIRWDEKQSYAEILREQEIEFCEYDFNVADIERLKSQYANYIAETKLCIEKKLVIPAHDYILKCSHTFNLLDTRGAIGLAERVKYFGEVRGLARKVSELFLKQRETLGFPLLKYMPEWKPPTLSPMPAVSSKKESLVLELGVEELASGSVLGLLDQLKVGMETLLKDARLSYSSLEAFATPRRLVIQIKDLDPQQKDITLTVRGPRQDVCEKNPKALEGFCRKNSIEASQVRYETVDGVACATATVEQKGKTTPEVLAEKIPAVLGSLRAEKNMRWLASAQVGDVAAQAFNRPIRWIIALFGSQVVPFTFACVGSGKISRGGRWEESPDIAIDSADLYLATLAKKDVTVDHLARKEAIRAQVISVAKQIDCTAQIRESLLDEVTQLVEFPTAMLGHFDESFRKLPNVVLAGTMESHQRCFPVIDKENVIVAFVAVRNGGAESIDTVRKGNERVIGARFSDAAFFVSRDETKKLVDFRERIKTLTFVEGLGSMFDKTERLKRFVVEVAGAIPQWKIPAPQLTRAAELSKADLGSQMVVEMSSLQGKMGRLYAERSGEDSAISVAIEEHYLPGFAADKIPASELGTILALSDKIDTVAALFSIGAEPTGSADPFGIRREALGIVSILLGQKLSLSLHALFKSALTLLNAKEVDATTERAIEFITKRLDVVLRDRGYRYDIVRAVLARSADDPARTEALVRELQQNLEQPDREAALTAYLRCVRIVDHAAEKKIKIATGVQKEKFSDTAEKNLGDAVAKLPAPKNLSDALTNVATITPAIHAFFETVMVMAEDEAVRSNRLALVSSIVHSVDLFADLRMLEASSK